MDKLKTTYYYEQLSYAEKRTMSEKSLRVLLQSSAVFGTSYRDRVKIHQIDYRNVLVNFALIQ